MTGPVKSGPIAHHLETIGEDDGGLRRAGDKKAIARHCSIERRHGAFRKESKQTDLLEFCFDDISVERLHNVFVGSSLERPRDMHDIVFGGARSASSALALMRAASRPRPSSAISITM